MLTKQCDNKKQMKLKQWQDIFHVILNANSVQHVNQIKKWMIKHVNVNVKIIINVKKIIFRILAHVFVRRVKYLKTITDTSVTGCDNVIIVINSVSTKKTNTIATNITSTASINFYSKKVRDCFILHTVFLVIIFLLIIIVICYHYAKQKGTI